MEKEKPYVVPYRLYSTVLITLLALTFFSVAITLINLGNISIVVALAIASVKAFLVLKYFMHLKYDKTYFVIMVIFVFSIILVTIVVTFLDYLYR